MSVLYDVAIIDWARGRHLIWVGSGRFSLLGVRISKE